MARSRTSPQTTYSLIAILAALLVDMALWYLFDLNIYFVWLIAINIVAFALFRFDKRRAKIAGAGRVPEIVLLACTITGGFLGAAGGMYMRPHHKTRKPIFVITLIVAIGVHMWLFSTYLS
jgi:uncharacterized membrane protein YsdA (DUF1294 family)